jgi:hypothetical protein
MTIWERVTEALSTLEIPLVEDVYIPGEGQSYPDSYAVFFLVDSPIAQAADNKKVSVRHRVQVNYFSISGLIGIPDITGLMLDAGFEFVTMRNIPRTPEILHYGLAMDYTYLEE